MKLLIDSGADVNRIWTGKRALHFAVGSFYLTPERRSQVIRLPVDSGAELRHLRKKERQWAEAACVR